MSFFVGIALICAIVLILPLWIIWRLVLAILLAGSALRLIEGGIKDLAMPCF